jgi:integrase
VQAQRRRDRKAVPQSQWEPEAFDPAALREGHARFRAQRLAASTARNYASQQQQYSEFAAKVYGGEARLTGEGVAWWIEQRARHDHRLTSIEAGVAALGHMAEEQGLPPPRSHPAVVAALKAAARVAPRDLQQKLPLTVPLLRAMVAYTEGLRDEWMIVRDKALFHVGFYGMFRGSELVGIRWEHVRFPKRGGVMIFVPSSKTDQGGQGAWVWLAAAEGEEGAAMDIAAALQQLKEMQGDGDKSCVFLARRDRTEPMAKATVTHRLRKALQGSVSDAELYASHSLRRGGATHAARSGVCLRLIKVLGRWRSDSVRLYLYCCGEDAMKAAERMLRAE